MYISYVWIGLDSPSQWGILCDPHQSQGLIHSGPTGFRSLTRFPQFLPFNPRSKCPLRDYECSLVDQLNKLLLIKTCIGVLQNSGIQRE